MRQHTVKPTLRRVISEDSDETVHQSDQNLRYHMYLPQPPGYQKMDERDSLPYWLDVQADPSLLVSQVLL